MKTKIFNKIICFAVAVCLTICCFLINSFSGNTVNAATDDVLANTEIKNDGSIISTDLWNALYRFYISENSDPNNFVTSFYPNSFKNFSTKTLNLSNQNLKEIYNLSIFDLSNFETINLSGNSIVSLNGELKDMQNLKVINLSNNKLTQFKYDELHSLVCANNLQILDISRNELASCDLSNIAVGQINLQDNKLINKNLILPTNTSPVIKLSHNLLQENIDYNNAELGFQGVKNNLKFNKEQKIIFHGLGEISSINIYKDNLLVETLNGGNQITLNYGNYKIKLVNEDTVDYLLKDINFSIIPQEPNIKLFQNNEEIEYSSKLYQNTTVKFVGESEAKIYCRLNNESDFKEVDKIELVDNGTNNVYVYQVVDGQQSQTYIYTFYMQKSSIMSWIILFIGCVAFVVFFFVIIKWTKGLKTSGGVNGKLPLD